MTNVGLSIVNARHWADEPLFVAAVGAVLILKGRSGWGINAISSSTWCEWIERLLKRMRLIAEANELGSICPVK